MLYTIIETPETLQDEINHHIHKLRQDKSITKEELEIVKIQCKMDSKNTKFYCNLLNCNKVIFNINTKSNKIYKKLYFCKKCGNYFSDKKYINKNKYLKCICYLENY